MEIRSLHFKNFKGFRDYRITLKKMNVLVGPNNAGKSSVLDALRLLMAAFRFARRRNPQRLQVGKRIVQGYEIPTSTLPVSLINLHSNSAYDTEATVGVMLDDKTEMRMTFLQGARFVFEVIDSDKPIAKSASLFRKRYPVDIFAFPTLGPLEETEEYLTDEYVDQNASTRRGHRMFRNIWFRRTEEFQTFSELVKTSWEGVSISPPKRFGFNPVNLEMYFNEDRKDREVSWAGFGFQVWLQLMTHMMLSSESTTLIIDEPEIYLHPDLQHRFFEILRDSNKQIILATHSAEIINDAERDEVLIVNRSRQHARRIGDIEGLQEALFSIGSAQNIHLTKLSRGRRVLFLEGKDFQIIRRFAKKLELENLASGSNLTVVPIGGFEQKSRIEEAAWTFGQVLKADIAIAALLDRDYRSNEEIEEIVNSMRKTVPNFHVLNLKEIENYLLVPKAIAKAAAHRFGKRESARNPFLAEEGVELIEKLLSECADNLRQNVLSQLCANRIRYFNKSKYDASTLINQATQTLEDSWQTLPGQLGIVSGKQTISMLNQKLDQNYGISISAALISNYFNKEDFQKELVVILRELENFASKK